MSSMLREILRWRDRVRRDLPSARWADWTDALIGRHAHVFSRHHTLAMPLVQPTILLLRTERWQHNAWNLFPQIKLAISPLLRETVWKVSPLPLPGMTKDFPKADRPGDRLASAMQSGAAATDEANAHDLAARTVAESGAEHLSQPIMIDRQKANARESLIEDEPRVERIEANWLSPLSRIFRRSRAFETEMLSSQTLLADESLQLVNRIAHKQARIEQTIAQNTVVQQQKQREVAAEIESALQKSSTGRTGVAFDQPPTINIAELAEQVVRQIDSRIVAHRERMGRTF